MSPIALAPDDYLADSISPMAALLAGKKLAPDATDLLIQDHRQVTAWFKSYDGAAEPARLYLVGQLCLHLEAHMIFEEAIFYEAARSATGDQQLIDHAYQEHREALQIIRRLQGDAGPGPQRDALVASLKDAIESHVDEEETVLFPKVRACEIDLFALGRRLAAKRSSAFSDLTGKPLPALSPSLRAHMESRT